MIRDKITSSPACALCGAKRKLEQSHIIPQFVYRWAKAAAGQDQIPAGPTRPMLCGQCEDLFSTYESEFARRVFHPFVAGSPLLAKYNAWLRKFAASVCWRILEASSAEHQLGHFNGHWTPELASCRKTWQRYLTGQLPDVGGHHLHLLPGSTVGSGSALGVQGRIDCQVVCTDHAAFVYAQLGPLILFGLIADPTPTHWAGTRLNAEGKLKPREVVIPALYRDYLTSRAGGST